MSFKEYDKKMMAFRPDLDYWETVLKELKPWNKEKPDGARYYEDDEIAKLNKTDRVARSTYIQGNTGTTDVYTNFDTAYEIREALRARYENTEAWGLTTLTEKYNETVRGSQNVCPDIWFDQLQYLVELIDRAGGAKKTDAEVVAHVIATAPMSYDTITTYMLTQDLKGTEILKTAREQYRNYWKRHFEKTGSSTSSTKYSKYRNGVAAYNVEKVRNKPEETASAVNRINKFQKDGSTRQKGKPWKKFKGYCRTCGKQGHKAGECTQNTTSGNETRRCHNCGKVGHLIKDCPNPKKGNDETMFCGHIGLFEDEETIPEFNIKIIQTPVSPDSNTSSMTSLPEENTKNSGETWVQSQSTVSSESKRILIDLSDEITEDTDEEINMVHEEDNIELPSETEGEEAILDEGIEEIEGGYQHQHIAYRGYGWHCWNCELPLIPKVNTNFWYCNGCETLRHYYSDEYLMTILGQCKKCGNMGPYTMQCPYCRFGPEWLTEYKGRVINFLKDYFNKYNKHTPFSLEMTMITKNFIRYLQKVKKTN
jgi:hypothetical protein